VRQLREKAQAGKQGFYTGKDAVDAGDLSLECLRLVYRLLFLFYIEARPELGYVPIQKSEIYARGYSLESLRDLELTPLNTAAARDGLFFDATLRRLFSLIGQGCGAAASRASSPAASRKPSRWRRSTASCSTPRRRRCSTRCVSPTMSGSASSA
jgi:hypothetical protein